LKILNSYLNTSPFGGKDDVKWLSLVIFIPAQTPVIIRVEVIEINIGDGKGNHRKIAD